MPQENEKLQEEPDGGCPTHMSCEAGEDGEVMRADGNQGDKLLLCAWWRRPGKAKERIGPSALLKPEHTRRFICDSPSENAFEKE